MKVNFWYVSIFGVVSFIAGFAIGEYSIFQSAKSLISDSISTILKAGSPDVPLACNDGFRYSNSIPRQHWGDEIPSSGDAQAQYQGYINNFSGTPTSANPFPFNSNVGFRGFFISKKIIDQIFQDQPNANGIACYLAKVSPTSAQCSVIVDWGKQAYTDFSNLDPNPTVNNSDIFICNSPQAYCPPNCGLGSRMK